MGSVVTVAEIMPKSKARLAYDGAVTRGDGAQLLEQVRTDVFQMSIGNLNPNDKCAVKIRCEPSVPAYCFDSCIHVELP